MEELLSNNSNTEVSKPIDEMSEKKSPDIRNEDDSTNSDLTESNSVIFAILNEHSKSGESTNIANSESIENEEIMLEPTSEFDPIIKQSEDIISVTKKKRLAVFDSDSESEEPIKNEDKLQPTQEQINSIEPRDELITVFPKKKSKWSALCDSDSSDGEMVRSIPESNANKINESPEKEQNEISISNSFKRRIITRVYSDSENEEQADNIAEEQHTEEKTYTIGSKGELILETSNNPVKRSKWAALCDSESSEDEATKEVCETIRNERNGTDEEDQDESIKPTIYKRKTKRKGAADEPKKMSGKDALKLKKEIQSESQRMLRETKVSLPYHKPKQFTLKEFLSRRPKLCSAVTLPSKVPASVAIKMPKEQLEVISKKLKEREKEVKEFYKSDSGSDNDDADDPEYLPEGEEKQSEKADKLVQEENEEEGEKIEENANDIFVNNENVDKEVTNNQNVTALGNEGTEMGSKPTENNVVDNLCHSENNFDSGIDIQEEIIENDTNISEKHKESCSSNGELQVEFGISEKEEEQNKNVVESVPEIEITRIENDAISEQMEKVCDIVPETEEEEFPSNLKTSTTNLEVQNKFSDDYEFNLDDLEDTEAFRVPFESNTSKETNKEILHSTSLTTDVLDEVNKNLFKNDDLDKEIQAFNVESKEVKKDLKISELLKEKLGNIKPQLSGSPDDIIDLELGVAKPKEIVTLMKRFEKHTVKKQVHKSKVHLNIVSVQSQGNIEKEVVSMEIDDDDSLEIEEKPGARFQRLRNELQIQIAKKKSEMWHSKFTKPVEKVTDEKENEDASSKPDYEDIADDILDDEDEEEMSESSEDDEIDSEAEEIKERSKNKKRSDFIDEEAVESDIEDEGYENADGNESNGSEKENEKDEEFDTNEDSEVTNMSEKEEVVKPARKSLKRIVKCFTEDSDDEDDVVPLKTHSEENCDQKVNDDDDMIAPHQIMNSHTPVRENSQQTQNNFGYDFLTPVSFITGIKNLTYSAAKHVKSSPALSPFPLLSNPNLPSPLKETDWQSSLQRKLFTDGEITDGEITDSQAIAGLCSGEFPSTQSMSPQDSESQRPNGEQILFEKSLVPTTQDLLNVCSGKFTGTSQLVENSVQSSEEKELSPADNNKTPEVKETDKRKSSDIDDVIISQLLDEEEMEKFKKKFESPGISNTQKQIAVVDEINVSGILDSDDEDDEVKVKRRKNRSKLTFSDDESSDASDAEKEEEIDLHDEDDEDEIENIPEPDDVEYDSEENEIELEENGGEKGTAVLKPSDFFDEEAELSESEWGSADEDENDLDTLEKEMGDTEKFDEKQLRRDLEKIHMRRMLDQDQREVKLLQELYLEDGELHGSGRQRQFRWKNIDAFNGEEPSKTEEDEVFLDEEESEEQWRKKRYEREQFLKEKQKSLKLNENTDLLSSSQIIKIGHKVLQRSTSGSASLSNTPNEKEEEIVTKSVINSLIFSNKRGSFLSRGEDVLQRIAQFNKVTETVATGATAKNSRNFLFQTVSVEDSSSTVVKDKKRKAADGTPNVIKKLRLSDNLSPANRKKKLVEPKAKTKLF